MQLQLICLYGKGVPLTKEQLAQAPRYTGNLIIEDTWRDSGSRRYFRMAKLFNFDVPSIRRELLPPLFDPMLIRMDDTRMIFSGYQIHVENQQPVHYAQHWAIKSSDQAEEG